MESYNEDSEGSDFHVAYLISPKFCCRSSRQACSSPRATEATRARSKLCLTVSKWIRNDAGNKELVKLQKRVRLWWREDVLGTVGLTVRYGSKAIEFEKGKTAIAVPNKDQLIATIDTVISAVRAGELDEHLTQ
jgi:hypothetical protein